MPPSNRTIVLPSQPTAANCIAWSDERLVVAGGEVVHAIDTTTSDWRFETIRVNEWDVQSILPDVASQADFSLGREQSNSKVVALAWSPRGLGIHKRPVLAILTSSHMLSLWEHNGTSDTWHRTGVVNDILPTYHSSFRNKTALNIHAFAWLPPLHINPDGGPFGQHFLSFIDGNQNLWTIQISKNNPTTEGVWRFGNCHQLSVNPSEDEELESMKSLYRQNLYAFDSIATEDWTKIFDDQGQATMSRIRLVFRKQSYRPDPRGLHSAVINVEFEGGAYALSSRMAGFASEKVSEISPKDFVDAIAEPTQNFDKEYDLHGHYSVNWMGFAASPDRTMMATCIVLRPSAGPEYTMPRDEQSTLLVVPTGETAPTPALASPTDVQLQILQSLTSIADIDSIVTDTDIKLLRTAVDVISRCFPNQEALMKWSQSALELLSFVESEEHTYEESDPSETCGVCWSMEVSSGITPPDDPSIAVCETGHRFHRCGITFMAIQDPGICKSCTTCGRKFLLFDKLEDEEGSSVARLLLDTCGDGLCPYCRGYFCG